MPCRNILTSHFSGYAYFTHLKNPMRIPISYRIHRVVIVLLKTTAQERTIPPLPLEQRLSQSLLRPKDNIQFYESVNSFSLNFYESFPGFVKSFYSVDLLLRGRITSPMVHGSRSDNLLRGPSIYLGVMQDSGGSELRP